MKKFVLGSVALAAMLATPAMAADMPVKARPVLPVCYDWSGFYAGAHVGWLGSDLEWEYVNPFITSPAGTSQTVELNQFLAGGHIGVQYQFGCAPWGSFVFGIEGASTVTHENSVETIADVRHGAIGFIPGTTHAVANLDEYHTVGIRLGWAWETWLFSVNGGYARGLIHTRFQAVGTIAAGIARVFGQDTHTQDGWYVGAAVEKMVAKGPFVDAILGFEYQYVRFDGERHCEVTTAVHCPSFALVPAPLGLGNQPFERDVSMDAHTIRARLTIKTPGFGFLFGGPVVP